MPFSKKSPDMLRGSLFQLDSQGKDVQERQALALEAIAECLIQLVERTKPQSP